MTDICSVWAYDDVKASGYVGKRQAQYLSVFIEEGRPLTHLQASAIVNNRFGLRVPPRNGRIAELEELGFLRKHDQVVCESTRKTVNRWLWTGRTTPLRLMEQFVQCGCCGGSGRVVKKVAVVMDDQMDFLR